MKCKDCPRMCKINRNSTIGFCGFKDKIVVAKIIENFMWEEPCISGEKGSLAIFFSGCNLKCNFCQNYKISFTNKGKEFSPKEFNNFLSQFNQKKYSCIEFISPTQFSSLLVEALRDFKKEIPLVWNSGGYETPSTIKKISKFVNVFLPDFKYSENVLSKSFSGADNYFYYASKSIKQMRKLKPKEIFNNEILTEGVLIRHLVLPGFLENSKKVLAFISKKIKNPFISLMSQFTPTPYSSIKRKIYPLEYKIILNYAKNLNLFRGYFQELDSANESFIPSF